MNAMLSWLLLLPAPPQDAGGGGLVKVLLLTALVVFLLFFVLLLLRYANLYIRSLLTKASVGLLDMFGMSLRRVSPAVIVNGMVNLVQARIIGRGVKPSRLSSALTNFISNAALWITNLSSPINSRNSSTIPANTG